MDWELLTLVGAALVGVGFVGILMMSLMARLREERGRQPETARSPLWHVAVVAVVVVLAAVLAGVDPRNIFRLALVVVLLASAGRYAWSR